MYIQSACVYAFAIVSHLILLQNTSGFLEMLEVRHLVRATLGTMAILYGAPVHILGVGFVEMLMNARVNLVKTVVLVSMASTNTLVIALRDIVVKTVLP